MRVRVLRDDLARLEADVAVCFAYEGDRAPRGVADRGLRDALAAEMASERFRGRSGDRIVWNTDGKYRSRRFLVVGLGEEAAVAGQAVRTGAAVAARAASQLSATRVALRLPPVDGDAGAEVRAAVEGAILGDYHFERHLTDRTRRSVRVTRLDVSIDADPAGARRAARVGAIAGRAVCLARDLVNEGPSRMNPEILARLAVEHAREAGLAAKVLDRARLDRLGMNALLAVARGSAVPARVVHLTYRPKGRTKPRERVVLVGKGVTFDSGGLNIKTGDSMLTMKCDMAGAAAVLAAMTTLAEIGCRAEVHGLLGLVENMTGAAAYKPGDVLDTWSGKTVEVMNTDAEGRLVLADLLAWAAATLKPTRMVDLATLTGACVVALGTEASGVFSRDDALATAVLDAGRAAGEDLWRLPLYDGYLSLLQRGPADLRSTGGRWGGAITAALFLGEFVPRSVPWLHLDIAGPAFTDDDRSDARAGGTGAGVRTLMRWLEAV